MTVVGAFSWVLLVVSPLCVAMSVGPVLQSALEPFAPPNNADKLLRELRRRFLLAHLPLALYAAAHIAHVIYLAAKGSDSINVGDVGVVPVFLLMLISPMLAANIGTLLSLMKSATERESKLRELHPMRAKLGATGFGAFVGIVVGFVIGLILVLVPLSVLGITLAAVVAPIIVIGVSVSKLRDAWRRLTLALQGVDLRAKERWEIDPAT